VILGKKVSPLRRASTALSNTLAASLFVTNPCVPASCASLTMLSLLCMDSIRIGTSSRTCLICLAACEPLNRDSVGMLFRQLLAHSPLPHILLSFCETLRWRKRPSERFRGHPQRVLASSDGHLEGWSLCPQSARCPNVLSHGCSQLDIQGTPYDDLLVQELECHPLREIRFISQP
jgi:hypothetical protein